MEYQFQPRLESLHSSTPRSWWSSVLPTLLKWADVWSAPGAELSGAERKRTLPSPLHCFKLQLRLLLERVVWSGGPPNRPLVCSQPPSCLTWWALLHIFFLFLYVFSG